MLNKYGEGDREILRVKQDVQRCRFVVNRLYVFDFRMQTLPSGLCWKGFIYVFCVFHT